MTIDSAPEIDGAGLDALEAILRRDLGFLNYPPPAWIPETRRDGALRRRRGRTCRPRR